MLKWLCRCSLVSSGSFFSTYPTTGTSPLCLQELIIYCHHSGVTCFPVECCYMKGLCIVFWIILDCLNCHCSRVRVSREIPQRLYWKSWILNKTTASWISILVTESCYMERMISNVASQWCHHARYYQITEVTDYCAKTILTHVGPTEYSTLIIGVMNFEEHGIAKTCSK